MLQLVFRKSNGFGGSNKLFNEKNDSLNVRSIQRIFRGFLGRNKARRRRMFLKSISEAAVLVSTESVTLEDVEELCGAVQGVLANVSAHISTALLSLFRGLMFLLRGDQSEQVSVWSDGTYVLRSLHANTLTWDESLSFIKRKAKLLRRLRAIAKHIAVPNPQTLDLSDSTISHLDSVIKSVEVSDFNDVVNEKARTCAVRLFQYLRCIRTAHKLQFQFPEYFNSTEPSWFKKFLMLKEKEQRTFFDFKGAANSELEVSRIKKEVTDAGEDTGAVNKAFVVCQVEVENARIKYEKDRENLSEYLAEFDSKRERKYFNVKSAYRSRELMMETCEGNFNNHINSIIGSEGKGENKNKDKSVLTVLERNLRNNLSAAATAFKEISLTRLNMEQQHEHDQKLMHFDENIDLSHFQQISMEIGIVHARLLTINESWQDFLLSMNGTQNLSNLNSEQSDFRETQKRKVSQLIEKNENLKKDLDLSFQELFSTLRVLEKENRLSKVAPEWDEPFSEEIDMEKEEDRAIARRAGKGVSESGVIDT